MPHLDTSKPNSSADQLSSYRLLGLVGQGQFAQVYGAIHRRTGQLVAIKKTRHAPEYTSQEPFVLQALNHPNVVNAQAILQTSEGYQFILDYCEGGSLRSHLQTAAPLPFLETKHLISDILKGLSHLHHQRIIHGDLKPENILLTYTAERIGQRIGPTAKIGDLGSARFVDCPSRSRREIGSPTYAAPERFEGESCYASDLYAVGVMLYELLLGDRPFCGSPDALRQAHQTQPVSLPNTLNQQIRQLLFTALRKQPAQRFPSAEAMLMALQQIFWAHQSPVEQRAVPVVHIKNSQLQAVNISLEDITEPIESLLAIPQGCCIITARSLHLLTHNRKLLPIARFSHNHWITVSPAGRWLIALPKESQNLPHQRQGYYQKPLHHAHKNSTSSYTTKRLHIKSPLPNALRTEVIQILAIDERHLLQVRADQQAFKTYLDCFARRGQFIGQVSFNLPLVKISMTAVPYQLIALTAPVTGGCATVILITLKPLQVRQLRCPLSPQRVNALSFGYVISGRQKSVLLDRAASPVNLLTGLPTVQAIAALDRSLLLATSHNIHPQKNLPAKDTSHNGLSSLWTIEIEKLGLDLIF
ncbi:MAG: serine/threonine-protein kinase [Phormidesmis sp.]